MKKQKDGAMLQQILQIVQRLEKKVDTVDKTLFQHSVAILELQEGVSRLEKRSDEMYGMLEHVTKKVSDHDDEIKANLELYDGHEKRLTTVENHLRLA